MQQARLETDLQQLNSDQEALQNELDIIRQQVIAGGYSTALVMVANGKLPTESSMDTVKTERVRIGFQKELQTDGRLFPLLAQYEELSQRFGVDHPRMKSLAESIRMAKEMLNESSAEVESFGIGVDEQEEAKKRVETYLGYLEIQRQLNALRITQLTGESQPAKGPRKRNCGPTLQRTRTSPTRSSV